MYQNFANQNPLINQFNGYMAQNPNMVPFQNNQLINNNVHVMNNLNNFIQQHKMVQQNIPVYQQQLQSQQTTYNNQSNHQTNHIKSPKNKSKYGNIIEDMLKPQKILKDNKDVESNYKVRKELQKDAIEGKNNIKMTNAPYKNIIKDKIITKKVEEVREEDLLVHKTIRGIDNNLEKFEKELEIKEKEKEKINDELKIEFHIDNYDKHKKKFEYKETFIRNLAFEENTFDENKQDVIEFYKKQQKEAKEGQKLCDQILYNLVDEGVISKDELPIEGTEVENNTELDLNSIINNIQTDEENNIIKDTTLPSILRMTPSETPKQNSMIKEKIESTISPENIKNTQNIKLELESKPTNKLLENNSLNTKKISTTKRSINSSKQRIKPEIVKSKRVNAAKIIKV